jgi:hypothetical protein
MGDADSTQVVVLHFRDGRTARCTLARDFSPSQPTVVVEEADGTVRDVEVDELKAVFFLKGRRRREADMHLGSSSSEPPHGAEARVEFFDGEIIKGLVQHYSVANRGFFLYPTAPESNNERVFVVASALTMVDIES